MRVRACVSRWLPMVWLLTGINGVLYGQGGANYTRFGLGQQRTTFGAAYESLAGASYAVPSDYVFGLANPALWALVKTTRIQGGYRFNQQRIEQSGALTAQNNGKLDGAAVLFAIDTSQEIAASVGVFPSSSINYASLRRFQVELPEIGVIDGTTTYRGGGGMVTAYGGVAWRVASRLYGGIALLKGFGLVSDQTETSLSTESSQTALSTTSDVLSTVGVRIGMYAELGSGVSAGIAATYFGKLSVERTVRYESTAGGSATTPSFDTTFSSFLQSAMPGSVGGGLTYSFKRWHVTLDGEYSPTVILSYRYQQPATADNSYRLSLAASYRGVRGAGASFEDRLSVNFGVGMQRLPVRVGGSAVEDFYASVGVQIPFGGAAMIDAALSGGVRGSNQSVREEYIRLSVTLSVGEVWFVPFRR